MSERKTQFKWFTIAEYEKEQEYLSEMHKEGWKLTRIGFPGWYHFEKCEPEDVVYQLDYNQDGIVNKEEYTQLFAECGWEYLFNFVGYSYFRKKRDNEEIDTTIFCDDASRLDMMHRVFKGRMVPILTIFFAIILPQMFLQMNGHNGEMGSFLAITYMVLFFAYVIMMGTFAWQYFQYEQRISQEPQKAKYKLVTVFAGLGILSLVVGVSGYYCLHEKPSVYDFSTHQNGYTISAEYFDERVEEQFDLEPGDEIWVNVDHVEGKYSIIIGCEGKDPIYTGHGPMVDGFSVTVQESGCYTISCEGIDAVGTVEFLIEKSGE